MQKFFEGGGGGGGGGGANLGYDKGGGAEAYVRCYTLHLLGGEGGEERGGGGGQCPSYSPGYMAWHMKKNSFG